MTTLSATMQRVRGILAKAGVDDPIAEARILVGGLLGLGRTDFITGGARRVEPSDAARIDEAVQRRTRGEPPWRILGHRAFHGLDLALSPATLEPRPDTEILVDTMLDLLAGRREEPLAILDLGTGTGAICLALLAGLPNAIGTGSDLSAEALATARRNAVANGLGAQFSTMESDWFASVDGSFDLIVSNPPYIPSAVVPTLDREVRDHDPWLALDGGADGLDPYRIIAAGAAGHLRPDGLVGVETGFDQRRAVEDIFTGHGFRLVRTAQDYGGRDRVQVFSP